MHAKSNSKRLQRINTASIGASDSGEREKFITVHKNTSNGVQDTVEDMLIVVVERYLWLGLQTSLTGGIINYEMTIIRWKYDSTRPRWRWAPGNNGATLVVRLPQRWHLYVKLRPWRVPHYGDC